MDQPESKFIFRIGEDRDGRPLFKLVEADGGLWKYDAVGAIKKFLSEGLSNQLREFISIIG